MTKGLATKRVVAREGLVTYSTAGNWDFIYSQSTEKDPAHYVGDTVDLPDGRSYTYAKSSAACISGQACEFTYTGYTAYTAFAVAAAVGVTEITIPAATHAALTQDELRNGYVIIFDGTTNNVQFRGIIGNDAAEANALFKVYLDGPLSEAVVAATSAVETYKNQFAAVRTSTSAALAKAGIPATKVSAANVYFWVQTAGASWAAPQDTVSANNVGVYWRHDGSIEGEIATGSKNASLNTTQYAGVTMQGNAAGNGPLLLLK